MDPQIDKNTSEYIWSLAEQRRRADDDRGAVIGELVGDLSKRVRCSINGMFGRKAA